MRYKDIPDYYGDVPEDGQGAETLCAACGEEADGTPTYDGEYILCSYCEQEYYAEMVKNAAPEDIRAYGEAHAKEVMGYIAENTERYKGDMCSCRRIEDVFVEWTRESLYGHEDDYAYWLCSKNKAAKHAGKGAA